MSSTVAYDEVWRTLRGEYFGQDEYGSIHPVLRAGHTASDARTGLHLARPSALQPVTLAQSNRAWLRKDEVHPASSCQKYSLSEVEVHACL